MAKSWSRTKTVFVVSLLLSLLALGIMFCLNISIPVVVRSIFGVSTIPYGIFIGAATVSLITVVVFDVVIFVFFYGCLNLICKEERNQDAVVLREQGRRMQERLRQHEQTNSEYLDRIFKADEEKRKLLEKLIKNSEQLGRNKGVLQEVKKRNEEIRVQYENVVVDHQRLVKEYHVMRGRGIEMVKEYMRCQEKLLVFEQAIDKSLRKGVRENEMCRILEGAKKESYILQRKNIVETYNQLDGLYQQNAALQIEHE